MPSYITNPQVIHETIDGETIIIDLASGTYFSLRGTAPEIWNGLSAGRSADQIAAGLKARYLAQDAEVEAVLQDFLQTLVSDGLISPGEPTERPAALAPELSAERGPFTPPKVERFTDMQDIILLDPVHKVDDQGWPRAAPAVSGTA